MNKRTFMVAHDITVKTHAYDNEYLIAIEYLNGFGGSDKIVLTFPEAGALSMILETLYKEYLMEPK